MRSMVLSDWEVDELIYYRKKGWSFDSIAHWFGIPVRTVERIYRREMGRSEKDAPSSVSEGK